MKESTFSWKSKEERAIRKSSRALRIILITVLVLCFTISVSIPSHNGTATTWESKQEISTDTGTEYQGLASIAVEGDKVHVVWYDYGGGDYDIYYRHYDGTSWLSEQEISQDSGSEGQYLPSIVAEDDKLYVVWYDEGDGDEDIYYRSFDGSTWGIEQEISTDVGTEQQMNPSIAVDNGRVHVVWQDKEDGNWDIFYRHFDGASWRTEEEISSPYYPVDQQRPSIAVEGNEVHVVWHENRDGDLDVFYRHFNGTHWEAEKELSVDSGTESQRYPSITVEGEEVHVVWSDEEDGDYDLFYRHFDGTSWLPEQEISTDVGEEDVYFSSIAVENGRLFIVWSLKVAAGWTGDRDIYYRYFDGTTWWSEQEISTDIGSERQFHPSIDVENGVVHVVWHDYGDGDTDVYYKKGVEDITPPVSNAVPISPHAQKEATFTVEWTASDDIGLASISLQYRYSNDNEIWMSWKEWDYNGTISGTTANGIFLFSATYGDGYYEFYTVATDSLGNTELAPTTADTSVKLDTSEESNFLEDNLWLIVLIVIIVIVLLLIMKAR